MREKNENKILKKQKEYRKTKNKQETLTCHSNWGMNLNNDVPIFTACGDCQI